MSLPATGYLENAARTEGEMKTALEDQLKGIKQIPGAGVADQALTLASDAITPALGASGIITVDTEAAAATDNLGIITQTNVEDGALLLLRNANAARSVVAKHNVGGTGQISLKSGGDFVLADPDRHWLMVKRAGTSFREVARFPSADLAPILSKSGNYTTTATDRGQLIDCTATLTLSLVSAATAGKGFEQTALCSGGTATIDPAGSETIGGATTLTLQRGDNVRFVSNGTNWDIVARFSAQGGVALHGHLWGLTLSNNGADAVNDIDVAVGETTSDDADSSNAVLMRLLSGLTKRLDAVWAVGTNAGLLASGAAIADTTYHIFLIMRPDTGVVDIAADTSVTGANLAANTDVAYTKKRRIGSILRESAAIVGFVQDGNYFRRKVSVLDVNTTNPGTSAVLPTLSVPTALNVLAVFNYKFIDTGAGNLIYFSDLEATDEAPSDTVAPLATGNTNGGSSLRAATQLAIRTDAIARVRYRVNTSGGTTSVAIATLGWIDTRGRDN